MAIAKKPEELKIVKNVNQPSRRDSFIERALKDKSIRDYAKQYENGKFEYNNDELKELLGYTFDGYNFDVSDDDDVVYNRYLDTVLDDYGMLNYYRANADVPFSIPSYWDKLSENEKVNEYENYMNAIVRSPFPMTGKRTKLYNDAGVLGRARIRGDKEAAKKKRNESFAAFKKSVAFPQNAFNTSLTDWDKVYNEFSQILGEEGALNLLLKYFNNGGQ